MVKQPTLNDVILRALRGLPQAGAIRAERFQWAADRVAALPRSAGEAAIRDLRGLGTPEIGVLVHEARGVCDSRSCARTIARAKLLERAPDLQVRHPVLDVALPLAASLLTQGHGGFALDLTHSAASARLGDGASRPWQLPDPAVQFVRMPAAAGSTRIGLAYVRPVADLEEAHTACPDAALALSLASYSAVADGVMSSRPDALFVLNVVAPGLEAWAPLLRVSPTVSESVRAALMQTAWTEAPPVMLQPVAVGYDMNLVRDALKVGEGFWQRCVLAGAVPSLPPSVSAPAAKLPAGSEERARHLVQQFLCMDKLVHGLGERMEVQRHALRALAADAALAVGTHGLGAGQIEVMERLDVPAAAEELLARGIAPQGWSSVDWDVEGMRAALEGLGVDVTGFARAGVPDADRMAEALGPDVHAFRIREVAVAWSAAEAQAGVDQASALAAELVANVSDLVFDQLRIGTDADGAVLSGAQAA
ncbi:hypothetical protein [Dolichospermum phage Dfl-JY45]